MDEARDFYEDADEVEAWELDELDRSEDLESLSWAREHTDD